MTSLLKTDNAISVHTHEPTVAADIVGAFFRRKQAIVIAAVAFVFLLTAFVILRGKSYQSEMMFLVRDEHSVLPTTSLDAHSDSQVSSATDTQIGTEIELLLGMELHRQVIRAMHPGLSPAEVDRALLGFDKNLQVFPIPKTALIGVTYKSSTAAEANSTLATLSKLYLEYRARIHGSGGAYKFFDQQAQRYHDKLQQDQTTLAVFNQSHQINLLNEEKNIAVQRLAEARSQVYQNQAALGEAASKANAMSSAQGRVPARVTTQKRDLPDQQGTARLNSILVDLENDRVSLMNKYNPTDRRIEEVDQKIANIRQALDRAEKSKAVEEQTDLNPLRQSIDSELQQSRFSVAGLQARQRSLLAEVGAYDTKLQALNKATADYDDLTNKIKDDQTNYELYSTKREGARIDEILDGDKIANVREVSGPAISPTGSSMFNILCVYVVGLLLIVGMGVLAGMWSPGFYSPKELEAGIGLPVLATIPLLKVKPEEKGLDLALPSSPSAAKIQSMRQADVLRRGALPEIVSDYPDWYPSEMSRFTAGIHSDGPRLGGAYFSLIEKLRRCSPAESDGGSIFAFTSCSRGEGVTYFVRGLADELTEYTGKKVAIVNALDTPLDGAERGGGTPAEVWERAPKSGEEFLQRWFQKLRKTHDYVLIDCPALSASHAATVFGPQSDGVVVVVSAGEATRTQLRGGLASLSLASVPVIGLALNKRSYPIPDSIYRLL